jgi:hypothetical protein
VRPSILAAAITLSSASALAQRADEPPSPSRPDPRVTLGPDASDAPTRAITIFDGVAASVATTIIAVPTSVGLANAMTQLSPDLLGGGIPALLWLGLAPPFAAHGLAALAMNLHEPGHYNLWPTIFATMGAHWGALAVGAVSGVWLENITSMTLFTVVEAVLLPAVAVTASWATRRPPQRASAARTTARAAMPSTAFDRAPLFRATLDARRAFNADAPTAALTVPVFSGSF